MTVLVQDDPRSVLPRPRSLDRSGRIRSRLGALGACALALGLAAPPASASVPFWGIVAERNLATHGVSNETFSFGDDSINRWNGALSYGVDLGQSYRVGGQISYQLKLRYDSNLWRYQAGSTVAANIDERFTAGAGWRLGFGELLAPSSTFNSSSHWVYRAPSGKVSRFYTTYLDGESPVANTYYTRDATFLRLIFDSKGVAHVAFDNGVEKQFFTGPNGDYRFVRQEDQFGNWFQVQYLSDRLQITDSVGRSHAVISTPLAGGHVAEVIDRVEVSGFGGTTAVYQMAYTTASIDRPPQDTDPATAAQQSAALLQSITRPDGGRVDFQYVASGAGPVPAAGRLSTVVLATGGSLEYTWQVVELPKVNGALHTADVVGIDTRVARKSSRSVLGSGAAFGTWDFDFSLDRDRDAATLKPREATTRVEYPDGFARLYKYSAFAGGDGLNQANPPVSFYLRDYAYPYTRMFASASDTLLESEVVLDAADQPVASQRISFQWNSCSGCWDRNPQPNGSQTRYHDGSGLVETRFSGSPSGVGRFGLAQSWDNAGEVPGRSTVSVFDHDTPTPQERWIATGWTSRTVHQGGETMTLERCIDPTTGQVTRERTLAGASPAAHDLLKVHEYHSTGERSTTRYFGGDVQPLPTGDLCTLSLPAQEQYAQYWSYQHGSLSGRGWLAADSSVFLATYSATIDQDTGLVASQTDAAGFQWTYGYDSLGRRISASPPAGHGGSSTTVYTPASSGQSAASTETTVAADGTALHQVRTSLDSFGHVATVERMSDAGWRVGSQTWDAQGRPLTSTSPDGGITRWLAYDPLGRPLTIRPPEGSVHDRTFAYSGRDVSETVKIGKEWNDITNSVIEIDRTVTTHRDRFGRRLSQQIVDADGDTRTETYTLDLSGSVISTTVTDGTTTNTIPSPNLSDDRGFQVQTADGDPITGYDALGLRTEVDLGQGTIAQVFDRAGRLVEQREGSPSGLMWLRNVYASNSTGNDLRGGKLAASTRYNRNLPHLPSSLVTVTDEYRYTGDGGSLELLETTVKSGSQVIMSFDTSASVDASGEIESLTFPDCDPSTNDSFSVCQPRATRVMSTERSYSELVRFYGTVGGTAEPWIDGVLRDSAGRITETQYGNGLVETRAYHPSGLDRLERLTLAHPSNGNTYDSGLAQYDGKGKLVKLGTDRHVSEHAYSLAVEPMPVLGDPTTLPVSTSPVDPLGRRTSRSYRVPNEAFSGLGYFDNVTELYIYGPGNRLVWKRRFNDYEVANYRKSEDLFFLIDPSGRQVREATVLTYYAGTNPQWSNAQVSSVWMHVPGRLTDDSIYQGGRLLGTTNDIANAPARTFLHRDFFGRRIAESFADGTIRTETSPLF